MTEKSINAYTFNYRGTWESEGLYLPETSLEDVEQAIRFLKSPQIVQQFLIDTSDISLIGYSYGGGFALLGSLSDSSIKKVVSIAGGDLSVIARMIEENDDFRKMHQQFLDNCMSDSTVCRGFGGRETHIRFLKQKDDYNLKKYSNKLADKDILLIGGWLDDTITIEGHILPLYRSLQKQGAEKLKIHIFETDHSLKNVRDALTSKIISWLRN